MAVQHDRRPKTAMPRSSGPKNRATLRQKLKKNLPDLKIFVSDYDKFPTAQTAFQVVTNPGTKFTIRRNYNALGTLETEKLDKVVSGKNITRAQTATKDQFNCHCIYLTIASEQGCTVGISCSFPEQFRDAPKQVKGSEGEEQGQAGAGGGAAEDGTSLVRVSNKDFRRQVQAEINHKMEELLGDMKQQREFFVQMEKMKRDRQRGGLKNTDINWIRRNTYVEDLMGRARDKLLIQGDVHTIKVQQALEKKQVLENERQDKIQFEMIKWDLYRIKCEDIEERYAAFKKLQLKIFWWNQIFARHRMSKKAKWNFDEHLKKVITAAREMLKAFKIQYNFKLYMRRHRPTKFERDRKKVKK